MEVHHHPDLHHKPKPWKEYLLEYLMIFLAVMTGFFAESFRERLGDNSKEREFIVSMIEDARTDTAAINSSIASNQIRVQRLDSLAALLGEYDGKPSTDTAIYYFFRRSIRHPDFVSPAERTLTQLKSSGSMRLIRDRASVDSIISYDNELKKLENQQTYYERYLNTANEYGMQVIDFGRLILKYKLTDGKFQRSSHSNFQGAKLLVTDKNTLKVFSNKEGSYSGVVLFYIVRLQETKKHAINLINTLKKQYKLEDE